MLRNREFPYGKEVSEGTGAIPVLFICQNERHREMVVEAFPIQGAMFVVWGTEVRGRQFDKVIVFTPPSQITGCYDWLEIVKTRLTPENIHNIHWV